MPDFTLSVTWDNLDDFIEEFHTAVKEALDEPYRVRAVGFEHAVGKLVGPTPFLTGRAKAGWRFTSGDPDSVPIPPPDEYQDTSEGQARREARAFINSEAEYRADIVSVANGVAYVPALNAQHRTAAGWIDTAATEAELVMEQEANRAA